MKPEAEVTPVSTWRHHTHTVGMSLNMITQPKTIQKTTWSQKLPGKTANESK